MFKSNYLSFFSGPLGNAPKLLLAFFILWVLFWKGLALWRAARAGQKYWFTGLLIVSTAGVLEIVYLAFFQKKASVKKGN